MLTATRGQQGHAANPSVDDGDAIDQLGGLAHPDHGKTAAPGVLVNHLYFPVIDDFNAVIGNTKVRHVCASRQQQRKAGGDQCKKFFHGTLLEQSTEAM